MKTNQSNHPNPKRRGELIEMAFMVKAVAEGYLVCVPYGDSQPYDFILDSGHQFARVQVKSTERLRKGGYLIGACHFSSGGTKWPYTAREIDYLAVCIVPEKAWYIIPVQAFTPQKWLSFYPHNQGSRGRFERFREAWCQMSCPNAGTTSCPLQPGHTVPEPCALPKHPKRQ